VSSVTRGPSREREHFALALQAPAWWYFRIALPAQVQSILSPLIRNHCLTNAKLDAPPPLLFHSLAHNSAPNLPPRPEIHRRHIGNNAVRAPASAKHSIQTASALDPFWERYRPPPTASQRSLKLKPEARATSAIPTLYNAPVQQPPAHGRQRAGRCLPGTPVLVPSLLPVSANLALTTVSGTLNAFYSPRPSLNAFSSALTRPTAPDTSSGLSASSQWSSRSRPASRCSHPTFFCPNARRESAQCSLRLLPTHRECAVPIAPLQDVLSCPVHCFLPDPRAPAPAPLATTSRQLPAAGLEGAAPRPRESVAFPAPRPCDRELPHEHLARQQEAAARLAALTPLPPSPTLSQEARDEALAVSLALGTSPPPLSCSSLGCTTVVQDVTGWAQTWPTIHLSDFTPFLTSHLHPHPDHYFNFRLGQWVAIP
jgi:hypothetical protein